MYRPKDDVRIVLGSSSPRRRELLAGLGLVFEIIPPEFDEERLPEENPITYALRNSSSKAEWVCNYLRGKEHITNETLVIGADTIVLLDDMVLEKPLSASHATQMLTQMSGRTHTVITALSLIQFGSGDQIKHSETFATNVTISILSPDEIKEYIATKEPMDKAGSYAIQGRGGYMVKKIEGSYSNVVGLPLAELVQILREKFQLDIC